MDDLAPLWRQRTNFLQVFTKGLLSHIVGVLLSVERLGMLLECLL